MIETHLQLVRIDEATRALAEAATVDEARQIVDMAEAMRVYAKKAHLGLEAQNHAAEIKLLAERRCGELLRDMAEKGERATRGHPEQISHDVTLADLGVEPMQSSRWQKVAAVPEDDFERYIAGKKDSGQEVTTAGLLAKAHVSYNSGENEWYTPAEYIAAARDVLGNIDLDPASSAQANEVVGADRFYGLEDDGLQQDWCGHVWMNPPYAKDRIGPFMAKMAVHYVKGDIKAAVILVNNATETAWFQGVAQYASAICFPDDRVPFWRPDGDTGAPLQGQAVLYLGDEVERFTAAYKDFGLILYGNSG